MLIRALLVEASYGSGNGYGRHKELSYVCVYATRRKKQECVLLSFFSVSILSRGLSSFLQQEFSKELIGERETEKESEAGSFFFYLQSM